MHRKNYKITNLIFFRSLRPVGWSWSGATNNQSFQNTTTTTNRHQQPPPPSPKAATTWATITTASNRRRRWGRWGRMFESNIRVSARSRLESRWVCCLGFLLSAAGSCLAIGFKIGFNGCRRIGPPRGPPWWLVSWRNQVGKPVMACCRKFSVNWSILKIFFVIV